MKHSLKKIACLGGGRGRGRDIVESVVRGNFAELCMFDI